MQDLRVAAMREYPEMRGGSLPTEYTIDLFGYEITIREDAATQPNGHWITIYRAQCESHVVYDDSPKQAAIKVLNKCK